VRVNQALYFNLKLTTFEAYLSLSFTNLPPYIAVAIGVRTKTFLWVRGAHPQKCPKHNGYGYN